MDAAHRELDMLTNTLNCLKLTNKVLLQQLEEAQRLAEERRSDGSDVSLDSAGSSGRRRTRDEDDEGEDSIHQPMPRTSCFAGSNVVVVDGEDDDDDDDAPCYRSVSVSPIPILRADSGPADEFDGDVCVDGDADGKIVWRSAFFDDADTAGCDGEVSSDWQQRPAKPARAPLDAAALKQCRLEIAQLGATAADDATVDDRLLEQLSRLIVTLRG